MLLFSGPEKSRLEPQIKASIHEKEEHPETTKCIQMLGSMLVFSDYDKYICNIAHPFARFLVTPGTLEVCEIVNGEIEKLAKGKAVPWIF